VKCNTILLSINIFSSLFKRFWISIGTVAANSVSWSAARYTRRTF